MSAWILGHKNPDSDSIVSAIACADLYRQESASAFRPGV